MSGFPGEQIFQSKREVKYVLQRAKTESKDLIVIFSAFPKAGNPPVYNYVRVLSKVNANRLFILDDFSPEASYYLAENRDFSIEESVIALIDHICEECGTDRNSVISIGSSKGGFAALYYGIKYGFGHVISAAPQTVMGNFVFNNHPITAEFIAGGLTDEDREYLNNILPNALRDSSNLPNIYLHIGRGDHHYKGHILPFVKLLDDKNANYVLDVQGYQKHSEVGIYFPDFLISSLEIIIKNNRKVTV